MLVKSIMTTPVITVRTTDSLAEAIALLTAHKLSGLAVVDGANQLCGILSEGDLLRRIELGTGAYHEHWWSALFATDTIAAAYRRANGRTVADTMSPNPVTIGPDDSLADAARLMEKHRIKRLPVVDGVRLVGILSRSDFVRMLGECVAPAYEEQATSDREIKTRILAEIASQKWSLDCSIVVAVVNGRVTLSGFAPSDEHLAAARVAAENVVGVVSVDNQIVITATLPLYAM